MYPPPDAERQKHILFVDDDELLVELNLQRLGKQGYKVIACTSSIQALRLFMATPNEFDLIVTDDIMPDISGIELAERMLKIRPDIPVILSASIDEITATTRAAGINIKAVSVKPTSSREITELIQKVLAEPSL